jgi:hypothetical protein
LKHPTFLLHRPLHLKLNLKNVYRLFTYKFMDGQIGPATKCQFYIFLEDRDRCFSLIFYVFHTVMISFQITKINVRGCIHNIIRVACMKLPLSFKAACNCTSFCNTWSLNGFSTDVFRSFPFCGGGGNYLIKIFRACHDNSRMFCCSLLSISKLHEI